MEKFYSYPYLTLTNRHTDSNYRKASLVKSLNELGNCSRVHLANLNTRQQQLKQQQRVRVLYTTTPTTSTTQPQHSHQQSQEHGLVFGNIDRAFLHIIINEFRDGTFN